MERRTAPIPEGYHSITPNLIVRDGRDALDYYKKAFNADVTYVQEDQKGKLMHATLKIGDSYIMLADECDFHEGHENCVRSPADLHGTTVNLYLYVEDVDSIYKQAINAGGMEMQPLQDMFWGDRIGILRDPFGHFWTVATQKEQVSTEQLKNRVNEYLKQQNY
jgi:PhnB protein